MAMGDSDAASSSGSDDPLAPANLVEVASKIDELGILHKFELTPSVRRRIEEERAQVRAARAAGPSRASSSAPPSDSNSTPPAALMPRLKCRLCMKPNMSDVASCTRCQFELLDEDFVPFPNNVFLAIAQGSIDSDTSILVRTDELLVLSDLYPMSETHLDVIPARPLRDVTELTGRDLPFVERMRDAGVAALRMCGNPYLGLMEAAPGGLASFLTIGFNYPVSVPQLHLHVVLPPLHWQPVFLYPRWLSLEKVLADLRAHGRVVPNQEVPRAAEVAAEHEACLETGRRLRALLLQHAAAGPRA